jgi:hypothetical protein
MSPEEQRVFALVAPDHQKDLDRLVGRYASGSAPVYRGSFSAHDNLGSVGGGRVDGTLATSAAIATVIDADTPGSGGPTKTLLVESPSEGRHVALSQAFGSTTVSMVLTDGQTGGITASCGSGGPPPFAAGPASIAIPSVTATGTWGDGSPMTVALAGTLSRIDPAMLAFDDVVHLAVGYTDRQDMLSFAPVGGEMVRTVEREFHEPTSIPAGTSYAACHHVTTYTINAYVSRTRLSDNGVRHLVIEKAQTCCVDKPEQAQACAPENRTCF